ncbi:MAG: N-acetyltransferase [Euryhalocaulis sp.]|uniref:GNAT family N-acetyltransferase n=1 Tax=Euryhalocaulis sp. TaxID=2744307 RepID=UPI0017CA4678|nr:GNAT family N-acetyltransferase [Euryhalocaulis sp.]MBA4800969.1 N-acetyltransferase [Euryhalocaulis sp.]
MLDTPDDSIRHDRSGASGRYGLQVEGAEAELTYRLKENVMVIDHTYTPPELRGQGLADRLVARAVRDARAEGWKVDPVCSYAARWFEDHPEHRELLA